MRMPRQLAGIAIGGSLLVVLAYPLSMLTRPHHGHPVAAVVLVLLPLVIAFVVSFTAASRLDTGVRLQQWPDAEVESARIMAASRPCMLLLLGCILAYLAIAFWSLWEHTYHANAATILLLPIMTISRLQTILRPPRATAPPIDWREVKPIQSDHWGGSSLHS